VIPAKGASCAALLNITRACRQHQHQGRGIEQTRDQDDEPSHGGVPLNAEQLAQIFDGAKVCSLDSSFALHASALNFNARQRASSLMLSKGHCGHSAAALCGFSNRAVD
jgi:hypothetical protein